MERRQDMAIGEVGEIILRGPNIMLEYYKNPEATAETLKGGWLYTGDMGYVDSEGYLYYTDRAKDMIVRGGFNVYSVEVESAIYEHPAVKQCAVVGKPVLDVGESPVAFVQLKANAEVSTGQLMEFTNSQIAAYKKIREVQFIDAIPVSGVGKVLKRELRDLLLEE